LGLGTSGYPKTVLGEMRRETLAEDPELALNWFSLVCCRYGLDQR